MPFVCQLLHRPALVVEAVFRLSLSAEREHGIENGSVGPVKTSSSVITSFAKRHKVMSSMLCVVKWPNILGLRPPSRALALIDGRKLDPELRSLTLANHGSSIPAACDEA